MRLLAIAAQALAVGLALIVLQGCRKGVLVSERNIPALAVLAAQTDALTRGAAKRSKIVDVEVGEVGETRFDVAIQEVRRPPTSSREQTLVLLHGVVADKRVWRYLAGELAKEYALLLVDLPGCGESDRPDPTALGRDAYTPSWLAEKVLAALNEHFDDRGQRNRLVLIGHSLGGTTILRMLGDADLREKYADLIAQVDRAVLLSPMDPSSMTTDPTFERMATVSSLEIAVGAMLGILYAEIFNSIYDGCCHPPTMPLEEVDRVYEIMTDGPRRLAAQLMLRRAIPLLENGERDWTRIERIVADYGNVDVPCLILWGGRDGSLPSSMGYKLWAHLPNAKLRVLRKSMHCLPSEEPLFCIEHIQEFAAGGGENWERFVELEHSTDPLWNLEGATIVPAAAKRP